MSACSRRGRVILLLVSTLVLVSCRGPADPLDVAVKEVPSDIVLGSPDSGSPAPPPIPPGAPVVVGPFVPSSIFDLPPSSSPTSVAGSPTTTAPAPACPKADPLEAPKREATNRIFDPPPARALPYRVEGTFTVSGANPRSGTFPPTSIRTVSPARSTSTGFTYTVAAELAGTTTTTTYQVVKASDVPGEAGLYVASLVSRRSDGATSRFEPPLPMKLVDLPMVANTSVASAGTDPRSATTVSWRTTVRQKVRVDACGVPLDAYRVELVGGRVDGPDTNVDFVATYTIATQFGGLFVADTIEVKGREGLDDVTRKITSIVSVDPGAPR